MVERRNLTEGLTSLPPVDPQREREFVYGARSHPPNPQSSTQSSSLPPIPSQPERVPISTRIRGDFAVALKRASLERELNGIKPHTLQDILEQALEPWLKANGYIH